MSCIPDDDDDEEESTCKLAAATNVPDNSKFIQSKLLKALFAIYQLICFYLQLLQIAAWGCLEQRPPIVCPRSPGGQRRRYELPTSLF